MKKYLFPICIVLCGCIPVITTNEEETVHSIAAQEKVELQKEAVKTTERNISSAAKAIIPPESCATIGGELRTEKKPPRSTFTVCILPNGNECELQALLAGTCPSSGIRGSAYATPAARYCGISGGRYVKTSSAGEEQGTCTLHGKTCDVWELWNGTC